MLADDAGGEGVRIPSRRMIIHAQTQSISHRLRTMVRGRICSWGTRLLHKELADVARYLGRRLA